MLKDLKRSGITPTQAKALHYKAQTETTTKRLTKKYNVKSYKIPYLDPSGKDTGFYRLRFLEGVKPAFAGKNTKSIRYWQPSHSLPRAYFPPVLPWNSIIKSDDTIYITEGEKKAAKGCLCNIPTIGLGGVWSWRSSKEKIELIEDLEQITWKEREVGFVFDNDMYSNPKVIQALRGLAKQLSKRGAKIFIVMLPASEKKIGLDDYLLTHKDLDNLETEMWEDSYELWKLNEEVAFVANPATYIHVPTYQHFDKPKKLADTIYANQQMTHWVDDKPKKVNVIKAWSEWPCRRTHSTIVYEPQGTTNGVLNLWQGWGATAVKGNVKPFLKLVDYLFENAEQQHKAWFMQWLAYPIQVPGTKMMTAVLLHSLTQGIGKSFLGYIVGDIYGKNFTAIGQDELHDQYNDWLVGKQFILGEEIIGTNRRQDADRIKNMITREVVGVSKKWTPRYELRDCVNYMFTSNHPDALFLSKEDRRVFVHEIISNRLTNAFYKEVDKWRASGGANALMYYLQTEVDTSSFDPYAPAPLTAAKEDLIHLSLSDVDEFCHTLKDSPETVLCLGGTQIARDMFTTGELLSVYDPEEKYRTSKIALSKALRRVGFKSMPARTERGTKRLYCVRNTKHWSKRTSGEWGAHYDGSLALINKPKKRKF